MITLTFNPTDFANLTENIGEPPSDGEFVYQTDSGIERSFVHVQRTVEGEEDQIDTVPMFLVGIDPALAQTEDEREAEYQAFVATLKERITEVYGDTVNEMNSVELARAIELYGEPVVPVQGADDIEFGCLRVNGELKCDPTAALEHGVLARAEDGSLYVTSSEDLGSAGDESGDVSELA